jgi:hypothetical protein
MGNEAVPSLVQLAREYGQTMDPADKSALTVLVDVLCGLSDSLREVVEACCAAVADWDVLHRPEQADIVKAAQWRFRAKRGENKPDEKEWPEPGSLTEPLPPVEPCPMHAVPSPLRTWIEDVAERIQGPVEYMVAGALAACGSLLGRRCTIRPLEKDDWTVTPNLWAMIIGDPAALKTPMLGPVKSILDSIEASMRQSYEERKREWDLDQVATKMAQSAVEGNAKKAAKDAAAAGLDAKAAARRVLDESGAVDDLPPIRERVMTQDGTIEALYGLLADNPEGLLVYRDELAGWLRAMERDGREAERAFYLEAWNGQGRFTIDRVGRGTQDVEALCVGVIGTIQPGVVAELVDGANGSGQGNDGLIQRFGLLVWPDARTKYKPPTRWPDHDAGDTAKAAILRCLQPPDGAEVDPRSPGSPPYVRFDAEAQSLFNEWISGHYLGAQEAVKASSALAGHLMKGRKLVPALALIDAVLAGGIRLGRIGAGSCQRALDLYAWLVSHARRLYASSEAGGHRAAQALAKRIAAGQVESPTTIRDIQRHGWSGLSDHASVMGAFDVLEASGWVRSDKGEADGPGRPRLLYTINPKAMPKREDEA